MLCSASSTTQQKENKGAQQKVKELEKQLNEQRVATARRESFLKNQLKVGAPDTITSPWLQMVCRSQLQRSGPKTAVPLPWTEIVWADSQSERCLCIQAGGFCFCHCRHFWSGYACQEQKWSYRDSHMKYQVASMHVL